MLAASQAWKISPIEIPRVSVSFKYGHIHSSGNKDHRVLWESVNWAKQRTFRWKPLHFQTTRRLLPEPHTDVGDALVYGISWTEERVRRGASATQHGTSRRCGVCMALEEATSCMPQIPRAFSLQRLADCGFGFNSVWRCYSEADHNVMRLRFQDQFLRVAPHDKIS